MLFNKLFNNKKPIFGNCTMDQLSYTLQKYNNNHYTRGNGLPSIVSLDLDDAFQ